jgi:hypothetical protein
MRTHSDVEQLVKEEPCSLIFLWIYFLHITLEHFHILSGPHKVYPRLLRETCERIQVDPVNPRCPKIDGKWRDAITTLEGLPIGPQATPESRSAFQ